MTNYDLLVIGEINPDLILLANDTRPVYGQTEKLIENSSFAVGSSSVIVACGAAKLGLRTNFVGMVGDDVFGRFMLEEMMKLGVHVSNCVVHPEIKTGFTVILSEPHDRALLTYPGTIAAFGLEHVDITLLDNARHLHISSFFLQDALRPAIPALFKEAKQRGLSTSLDTNWDPLERWEGVEEALAFVDVFLPNEAELRQLAGGLDVNEALAKLGESVPFVAVKLGAAGGALMHNGRVINAPVVPVEVVDTTGAGDSFDAGFLYGFLNGYTPEQCLRLACASGSLSTRAAGGTAKQATAAELEAAVSTMPA